jgi:hypothetical protein
MKMAYQRNKCGMAAIAKIISRNVMARNEAQRMARHRRNISVSAAIGVASAYVAAKAAPNNGVKSNINGGERKPTGVINQWRNGEISVSYQRRHGVMPATAKKWRK